MKILLDASALQVAGNGKLFWCELVMALSRVVSGDELIVLQRGGATVMPELASSCRVLSVPPADRLRPALEAERLACLCRRLEIDLFVGSYYTCPASDVASLLFVYDLEPELFPTMFNGDDDLLVAKRMAVCCAHSFVVLNHAVAADLSAFYDIDAGRISCIPYLDGPECSGMENFARNLLVSGKCTAGSPLSVSEIERRAKSHHCVNQQVSSWQAYEFASHTIYKLLDHQYFYQAATMSKGVSVELEASSGFFDEALHRNRLPAGLLEKILTDKVETLAAEGGKEAASGLLYELAREFPHNAAVKELLEKLG
jgi:hypothetical protein